MIVYVKLQVSLGFWLCNVAGSDVTLKNDGAILLGWGEQKVLRRQRNSETLVKTLVILVRNTTWRCGKLERSVVSHLHRRHQHFGKPSMSVNDIMQNMKLDTEKQNELLDAIKRLEKRNIVRLLPL